MAQSSGVELPAKGGFSFDLCRRNEMLIKKGVSPPSFRKTGTTIVGLIFQKLLTETATVGASHEQVGEGGGDEEANGIGVGNNNKEIKEEEEDKKSKKKERLRKEAERAKKKGVCYLSRIPPHMDHVKLRHILSHYGDILRIYLAPEDPVARVHRKRAGGFLGQGFSEGWVEFADKRVAKRVANMLNGEQIGGRKRSQFYFDLWNIKYLSKFKWDDLTQEIAYKSAEREQKIALALSAAKKERDFFISKVEQTRALTSIEERKKKMRRVQQELGAQSSEDDQAPKVFRQFPQIKPVADKVEKGKLSKDILAGVFGGSK